MALAGPKNSDSAACFNVTKDRSRHRVALALSDTERKTGQSPLIRVGVQRLVFPVPPRMSTREACIAVAIAFFGGALRPSLKDTVQASRHGER